MRINIIHILLFLIIICLLYTLLSNCGCNKDGFSVGVPDDPYCGSWSTQCHNSDVQIFCPDMCSSITTTLSQYVEQNYSHTSSGNFNSQIRNSLRIYSNNANDLNVYYVYYNPDLNIDPDIYIYTIINYTGMEDGGTGSIFSNTAEDLNRDFTIIPPTRSSPPPARPSPSPSPPPARPSPPPARPSPSPSPPPARPSPPPARPSPSPSPPPARPSPPPARPSSCTPFLTDYNEDILNWSTDQNPYGIPMFDDDTTNYLRQGQCPTCQTYALISCLSCMYNIELYKIHLDNNNCGNFTPITISPRSLIDIYYKYKIGDNTYDDDCTSVCRISKFASDFYQSNSLLMYQYFHNHFNNGRYPLIKNHAVKKSGHNQGNQYMNITGCFRESKNLFDETLESLNNPDFSYTSLFDPTDLIYINYGEEINISRDFNEQIIRSGALDGNGEPRDVVTNRHFIDRLKTELKQGPIILGISVVRGLRTNGLIDIVDPDQQSEAIMQDGAHNLLLIGYENDNAIILNSWNPNLNSDDTPGTLQYYITNNLPLIDIYNDYMNWYNVNNNSNPSTTGIFRINITIPESYRQIISESLPPCDRYDCNNRGNPIRRDQNNNCICECDEERFTGNDCSQTFQTCGDTDHNNPNTIIPFNCDNIGTLKSNPYNIICDRGDCTYDMCCNSSPSPPPPSTNPGTSASIFGLFDSSPPPPPDIDSDSSPSAMNTFNAIACQGIMDDVNCYNGGTLESSPTCRCECPRGQQGYFGENCEKSCQQESNRIVPIINRLFESGSRYLLNEQQQIEVNSYLDFCQ